MTCLAIVITIAAALLTYLARDLRWDLDLTLTAAAVSAVAGMLWLWVALS